MEQENERILDLCRKVSMEKDSNKMTDLVRQLNVELDKLSPKKRLDSDEGTHNAARSA